MNEDKWKFQQLKEIEKEYQKINGELREENKKLKEVIEEVREYIKEWQNFPHTNGVIHNELRNLLQILDKGVKDE